MDEELIENWLKENLSINLSQVTEFGPIETIKVELCLCGKIISEESCNLPEQSTN